MTQNYQNEYGNNNNSNNQELGFLGMIRLLMREIWLMFAIFSLISALGISFAMTLTKQYTAEARLSVLVGDEYVFSPSVGEAGVGQSPKQEQIVQSEIEIITSSQVAARVVKALGLDRLFEAKDLIVTQGAASPENKFNVGVDSFIRHFSAYATPNTTVIRLAYTSKNPQIAAQGLNTAIDEYLKYRREVLFEDRTEALGGQKNEFSNELDFVNMQLNSFLAQNNISDFDSEMTSLQNMLSATRQELLMTTSRRYEAEGRYGATAQSFQKEPSQIQLSFESDISKRRIDLQEQLADLLTKYTENSQPVIDMRRRIKALDALLDSPQGRAAGVTKIGPNPVRDSLATDAARANAEVLALKDREAILGSQIEQLQQRAMNLSVQKPQYEDLLRKKAILEDQVKQFATREATARAKTGLVSNSNDNIRVIERALPPVKGQSMKKLVVLGSLLFAGFTALIAGTLRALLRNEKPAKGKISNALGVPILATISR